MIVITIADCPPKVRGDISKWLIEISAGVFVGKVSARVREELWERICANIQSGQVTMVYSAAGEQHMDFRVHNTPWEPVDYDGLKLVRRPPPQKRSSAPKEEAVRVPAEEPPEPAVKPEAKAAEQEPRYVIFDTETTGLEPVSEELIEVAAVRIEGNEIAGSYSSLIRCGRSLSKVITDLTGITDELLAEQGRLPEEVLPELLEFIGDRTIVCHNASFDSAFLQKALRECGMPQISNPTCDTVALAKKKLPRGSLKLAKLAERLQLEHQPTHRALQDCLCTAELFLKLKSM